MSDLTARLRRALAVPQGEDHLNYLGENNWQNMGRMLESERIAPLIEGLLEVLELSLEALKEHEAYALECRMDWSDYDGRGHLSTAKDINAKPNAALARLAATVGEET